MPHGPDSRAPFTFTGDGGRVLSTAVHAGHALRPATAATMALDEATRLREEDPYTDQLLGEDGVRVAVHRSRFEVDLNRAREEAVYRSAEDAWGLQVWDGELPSDVADGSLEVYDDFYAAVAAHLDTFAARGRFLVLDLHSYNHRRGGPEAPAEDPADNPEINVGTGALDRDRWGGVIDTFVDAMRAQDVQGHQLDVRENVRFRGGHLSRWVVEHYPETGSVLAIEFKKVFMDEWTGACDRGRLAQLRDALATAVVPTLDALDEDR